jgi:hypothetical protein
MWSHLDSEAVDRIGEAIAVIHQHAPAISALLGS